MTTYYKPTQWRRKRVDYASIEPGDAKRHNRRAVAAVSLGVLMVAIFVWLRH